MVADSSRYPASRMCSKIKEIAKEELLKAIHEHGMEEQHAALVIGGYAMAPGISLLAIGLGLKVVDENAEKLLSHIIQSVINSVEELRDAEARKQGN